MILQTETEKSAYAACWHIATGAVLMGADIDPDHVATEYIGHLRYWDVSSGEPMLGAEDFARQAMQSLEDTEYMVCYEGKRIDSVTANSHKDAMLLVKNKLGVHPVS